MPLVFFPPATSGSLPLCGVITERCGAISATNFSRTSGAIRSSGGFSPSQHMTQDMLQKLLNWTCAS